MIIGSWDGIYDIMTTLAFTLILAQGGFGYMALGNIGSESTGGYIIGDQRSAVTGATTCFLKTAAFRGVLEGRQLDVTACGLTGIVITVAFNDILVRIADVQQTLHGVILIVSDLAFGICYTAYANLRDISVGGHLCCSWIKTDVIHLRI